MTAAQHGYVICAMPRSGSYYFCELLASTGVLGRPTELLNPDALQALGHPPQRDDPRARLRQALELGATANGVYGLKVLAYHFDHYTYPRWMYDLPQPAAYVYLGRDDLLSQALSLAKALQTRKWTSKTDARSAESTYDEALIRRCLSDLVLDEARWRGFFARNDLSPLRLSYEAITKSPQAAVDAVATLIGIGPGTRLDPRKLSLEIQRDEEARVWRERFLSTNADLGYLDSNRLTIGSRSSDGPSAGGSETIVVWGTGSAARTTIAQRFDLSRVGFFVDSDPNKQGTTFLGLPVRAPEALFDQRECTVVIGSVTYEAAIRHEIDERFGGHVRRMLTLDELLLDARAAAPA